MVVGVLPLALLWFLAGYVRNDAIEAELAAKASAQYPWATVSLAGRDITLSGVAPDEASRDGAVAAVNAIAGVRKVAAGEISVVPEQKPFTFEAKRDGDAVTLSGFVPSEDLRKTINDAVKTAVPSAKVTDNLAIARGAPAAFAAAAAYGISQLATLPTGAFSLSDVTAKLTALRRIWMVSLPFRPQPRRPNCSLRKTSRRPPSRPTALRRCVSRPPSP